MNSIIMEKEFKPLEVIKNQQTGVEFGETELKGILLTKKDGTKEFVKAIPGREANNYIHTGEEFFGDIDQIINHLNIIISSHYGYVSDNINIVIGKLEESKKQGYYLKKDKGLTFNIDDNLDILSKYF